MQTGIHRQARYHVPVNNIQEILNDLQRGVDSCYSLAELKRKLESGRPLNIKLGMDPTAPDIHLGHTVVLRKMRQFQDMGHKATLIIGDYTARIGDPTGRDTTRPVLDEQAISDNAQTYLQQAGKILDTAEDKLTVRYNSQWLAKLSFVDVLKLTAQVTVSQMLHRENFKKRMADEKEIVISEFMYPLMQAYDSVVIKADVELGGTDQTFNNLMGRQLQERDGQEKQVVMVMPILVGLDGTEKMSKSKGNYIAVNDTPNDMFGKIMSIPDSLMRNYYELLTNMPADRIDSLLDEKSTHPREAKDVLGRVIVEGFYSPNDAVNASEEFRRRFAEHKLPSDLKTITASTNPIGLITLIREAGFATSNSDARRSIEQGAVSINNEKIKDPKAQITLGDQDILKAGKRKICKVITG